MKFRFRKKQVEKMSDDEIIQQLIIERVANLHPKYFLFKKLTHVLQNHTMKMKYNAKSLKRNHEAPKP